MFIGNTILPLAKEDYRFGDPIVRVPNRAIKDKLVQRRQPVMVQRMDDKNSAKVLRFAMGVGRAPEGFDDESLMLDYDARRELGLRRNEDVSVMVRPAKQFEIWQWYWRHDQPVVRLGFRLGVLSVVLGAISVLGMI